MKILFLSDQEQAPLWDHWCPERTAGIDLLISCGDLKPEYLEFLVTMTSLPLLYVRGNHDGRYDETPPLGCVGIDDRLYAFQGLRILGLGGSMRYRPGSDQYTEEEMARRIRRLHRRLRRSGGFDLLVTHAPARGYGDLPDLPHRGFACFNDLLLRYRPACHCYGHVHREYGNFERERLHPSGTRLINCYGSHILELERK